MLKVACRLLASALLVTGCNGVQTVRYDGSTIRHHFGYVRVIVPPTVSSAGTFSVAEIETLGLRVERGLGIGFFRERHEYIPLDCRLVIRVVNEKQLTEAVKLLAHFEKEGLCVTTDPQ